MEMEDVSDKKPTVEVTEATFDETTRAGIVLLDFWAAWCAPCRFFAPIFEAAARRHPDVVFGKVDTQTQRPLARRFGITAIPTLMVLRDGIVVTVHAGVLPSAALDGLIDHVRALDMDELRRTIAAQEHHAHV
jgi:thioredoxin 1